MLRYEREFPDLFATLPPERRWSINAALDDDRLEGGTVQREHVKLLVRSVIEDMSDADYLREVLELVGAQVTRTGQQTHCPLPS